MSALNVKIVQADLAWHEPAANRKLFSDAIDSINTETDLIVLPEMFTTGFTMDAVTYAEPMDGDSMLWIMDAAARSDAAICGSLIIQEEDRYYNRFVCMRPDGNFDCYDKRHLFRLANEQQHYTAGTEAIVFELGDWRVCPMVCYDLRFPVWSRNVDNYDLLIYVANWPSARHHAWETLLQARAIENLAYVAGVNRTGRDGNGLPYVGGSAVVDYLGETLTDLGDQPGIATASLNRDALAAFREKFPFDVDADSFSLS